MDKELGAVLLVEDSRNDVELTLDAFAECRLANPVVVASDGAEALDYLHRRGRFAARTADDPVVLLLDIKMPKVDGLEVLRQMRADSRLKSIPVVMLSTSHEEPDLRESYRLGANGYVVKPVQFRDFMSAVAAVGRFWGVIGASPHGLPLSSGVLRQRSP